MGTGIITRLRQNSAAQQRASIENPSTSLANPSSWLIETWGGGSTTAGVNVNAQNALNYSAVWACVNVLSQDVAKLPLVTYERMERGRRKAYDHPLYSVLHTRPNPEMSAFNFRRTLTGHVVTWGNAYAEIQRDGGGRPVALWPLLPDRTEAKRIDGQKVIITRVGNTDVVLDATNVLHLSGLGFDGLRGYSVITYARQSIGLGLAAEKYGSAFFGAGARPSGIIKRKDSLTESGQRNLRASWENVHGGLSGAQRIAILDEGMEYQQIAVPPEDAQFLQTRQFAVEEVARWFRVPPHKIQHLLRSTFSNEENQERSYVRDALQSWIVTWEQELNHGLLGDPYYCKHNVEGLLRGDSATRSQFYQSGVNSGWLSPNDVREFEDLNPVDGGDVYLVPLNLAPIGSPAMFGTDEPEPDEPEPDEPEEEASRTAPELREAERRSLTSRKTLMIEHQESIAEVARQLTKIETTEVLEIADKTMFRKRRDKVDFLASARRFYEGRFAEEVRRAFAPIFERYGANVYAVVSEEMGITTSPDTTFEDFIAAYVKRAADRWAARSYRWLEDAVAEAVDSAEAVAEVLDRWENGTATRRSRSEQIAHEESVRGMGAFSKAAYIAAGVLTLVWRSVGDNCPFCTGMDGRVVGIQESFAGKGDNLDGGERGQMSINSSIGHPPLHRGCDCMIGPGSF